MTKNVFICKTSPSPKEGLLKQPLDERSKGTDKSRCHKQWHHRTHGKYPQRYREDEILQAVSSEKPWPTAQYLSGFKYGPPHGNAVFVE